MPFITLENLQRFHTNLLNFLSSKQDTLVSGKNISTINGVSLLDGGDISITAEGGTVIYDNTPTQGSNNPVTSNGIYTAIESVKNSIDHTAAIQEAKGYTDTQINVVNTSIQDTNTRFAPYVLYESSTVNYDNITLSDSVGNYDFIEIFGQTSDGYCIFTKVHNPDGKKVLLSISPVFGTSSSTTFEFQYKEYTISGNTLTQNSSNSGSTEVTGNGKHNTSDSTSVVGVTCVIGYKNI